MPTPAEHLDADAAAYSKYLREHTKPSFDFTTFERLLAEVMEAENLVDAANDPVAVGGA